LPFAAPVAADVATQLDVRGFMPLPIRLAHTEQAGRPPGPHRDPLDRVLIAPALTEELTLVSNEEPFDADGVRRLW